VTADKDMSEEEASSLFNYGVACVGERANVFAGTQRTYVVLGVSRGGTSAISGLLSHFGVYMGRSGQAPLFENLKMNKALRGSNEDVQQVVSKFNREHDVWGFKGNAIPQSYSEVSSMLRNPVYVVVFRDLLAIANRAMLSANRDILNIMNRQLKEYQRIIEFVNQRQNYFVLVSYEKLTAYPEAVVSRIARGVDIAPGSDQLSAATAFITPAPANYLKVSRAKKSNK